MNFAPFEDLIWQDEKDHQRYVLVADRRDRPKMKWGIYEYHPAGGYLNIGNTASLRHAIGVALREVAK